jgi:isopenicillin-N N-acyltransferase-like protein
MLDVVELGPATPEQRGRQLGRERAAEIRANLGLYSRLFDAAAGEPVDLMRVGAAALGAIDGWAPALGEEIAGIAAGAGLPAEHVAALNARTEVLALTAAASRGECSAAVVLDGEADRPVAVQTWDWHEELSDGFHVLQIEHEHHVVRTFTEYGIVGKIGVSSRGLGVLVNILHHQLDGNGIGVPVHVIARRLLDEATHVNDALRLVASARPSASSALTLIAVEGSERAAITAEVFPDGPRYVLPDRDGVLLHTNHFLAAEAAIGDRERIVGPDSYLRLGILRRTVRGSSDSAAVRAALSSRLGGGGAICCAPDPDAVFGERWATLATIELDVPAGRFAIRRGGPDAPIAHDFRPVDPIPVRA